MRMKRSTHRRSHRSHRVVAAIRALWIATVGTGCAIQTAHLPIQRWPVEDKAAYYAEASPCRILVLPLIDRRPAVERDGQRPRAVFLLVWNRRVGDYYTSDLVFGRDVGAQLAGRLAAYLRSAHAFRDVTLSSSLSKDFQVIDASTLQRVDKNDGVDYVLGGELQHFFGSQHQQFSMAVLPLYFVNAFSWQDGKGLPWGKTSATFSLWDARSGNLVWRHQLEATQTLPTEKDSMAQAALESFVLVTDQLAAELRQLPLEPLPASAIGNEHHAPAL